jgi:hypothetical protein
MRVVSSPPPKNREEYYAPFEYQRPRSHEKDISDRVKIIED